VKNCDKRNGGISDAISALALDQLDRIAIGVCDPAGAQPAVEKIMDRCKHRRACCGDFGQRGIAVVCPQHDFDATPVARLQTMMICRGLDGRDAKRETVELELDVRRVARCRRAKRSTKPSFE
jgi:hypothetical protein